MPIEDGRRSSLLKIVCPDEGGENRCVYIPVIDEIVFTDQKENGQEFNFILRNLPGGTSRKVRTKEVKNAGVDGIPAGDAGIVEVERIDEFTVFDAKSSGQEFTYRISNKDPPPATPDAVGEPPQHWKVRYVRYTGFVGETPDPDVWIDVEVIDELSLIDQKEDAQERLLILSNNPGKDGDPVEDGDPYEPVVVETPELPDNDQFEKPWRTDPFQNIVNVQWWPVEFICFALVFFTQWNIGGWGQYLPDGTKVMDIDHLNFVDFFTSGTAYGGPDLPMPPNSLRHVQLQLLQFGPNLYYHGNWHPGNVGMPPETRPTGSGWTEGIYNAGALEGTYVLFRDLFFPSQQWFIYGSPSWHTHCFATMPKNAGGGFTDSQGNTLLTPDSGSLLPPVPPELGTPNPDYAFGSGSSVDVTLRGVPYQFEVSEGAGGTSYSPVNKTRDYIFTPPYTGYPRVVDPTKVWPQSTYFKGDWIGDNGEAMGTDQLTIGGVVDFNGKNYNPVGWQIGAGEGFGRRDGIATTEWSSWVYVLYQRELDQ